ncbi:MAG: decaprenyl-phosphate phosphoribosyltransferase [Nitriliruptorales bacterium]|nr:decaprenyl-phosphate phosphoribosyltransferase [Nitriliruptorales bacterium]
MSQHSPQSTPTRHPRRRVVRGLLRACRPKQWIKNVLVVAAPAAAGVLFRPEVLARAAVAFVCFCLVASGTYLLNDAMDVQADRQHPRKRHRPVAAGVVPVPVAVAVAGLLLVAGLALALVVADWRLAVVLAVYVGVMLSYSLGLKRVAVIELSIVSSGFVIRAIAGGVAAGVELSTWFLIVTSFASLFIVAGKRHAEVMTLGTGAVGHREALREYPEGFIQYVAAVSAAVAIMAYCLWSLIEATSNQLWFELSIVPFVLAMLRYALLAAKGEAGAPEDVFASDRTLQILGLLWLVTYGGGVYAG